jgi:threonine dehydrogenase-like Zn-dependent dehydrogenase
MCASGLSNHCRKRTVLGIAGRDGAFAEYLVLPEANLQVVDEKISDEQAVFVKPLAAAFQIARQVPIDKRWKIAVLGDGRLGLLVAQVLANLNKSVILIGKHPGKLLVADKKGIRVSLADKVVANNDYDLVVECTGSASGLTMASKLVRPRGTVVLKSTYAGKAQCDLSLLVVNEVTLIGSRCGTFSDAIEALKNGQVDVSGMISRVFPFEQICEAMELAGEPETIKVLLRMSN